jgi:hypothetical protein
MGISDAFLGLPQWLTREGREDLMGIGFIEGLLSSIALLAVLAICLSRVPSWSSGASEVADVITLLRRSALADDAIIYELGCGWGTLLMALARAFPRARIRGIEISPSLASAM